MLVALSLKIIAFYQSYIRVFLPCSCRFVPSCSDYAKAAILKYGFIRGGIKACKRLLACHPFSGRAGYDPLV
ncbi:MAG: membrane protein insertion efficiency factor YidD [Candidatus Omnitrophica bacterium]|nr:membrane protein insertion efficiency factor YidD [Candidatus Omnitrophota bacterium]